MRGLASFLLSRLICFILAVSFEFRGEEIGNFDEFGSASILCRRFVVNVVMGRVCSAIEKKTAHFKVSSASSVIKWSLGVQFVNVG